MNIILTKRQLNQAILDSLFKPVHGRSLGAMKAVKLDSGKYRPDSLAGKEVPAHITNVYAVWVEQKRDSNGPYDQIMCYSTHENGEFLN